MTVLPDKTLRIASGAVHDLLQDLAGVSVGTEVRDRIVEAVVETLGDEGLILVRRDDLDAIAERRARLIAKLREKAARFHDEAAQQVTLGAISVCHEKGMLASEIATAIERESDAAQIVRDAFKEPRV